MADMADMTAAIVLHCRSVLGLVDATGDSNFFAVGGDSLSAIELCAWIEEEFDICVELSAIWDGRSIAEMARAISADADTTR